mmetsp:Transcript_38650/g.118803  ORF Transcript_38650/g.118803 Transcript_38650/m.118803 type:complete len:211 (-) Transcript_38650:76-708(-)
MQSPSRCHRSGPITDVTDSERVRARASSAQPASSRSAACSSAGAPREGPKAPPASRIRTSSSKTARARAAPSPGTTSVPSSASPSSSDLPAAASAPRSSLASSLTPRRCDSHFAVRAAPRWYLSAAVGEATNSRKAAVGPRSEGAAAEVLEPSAGRAGSCGSIRCMSVRRPQTAPMGMPPPRVFPYATMSATTPKCRCAPPTASRKPEST